MHLFNNLLASALLAQLAYSQAVYFYSGGVPTLDDGGKWPPNTELCRVRLIDIYGCSGNLSIPIGIAQDNSCLSRMFPVANLHNNLVSDASI